MNFKIDNPVYLRKDLLLALILFMLYCYFLYYFGTHYDSFKSIIIFGYSFKPTSWLFYLTLILILLIRRQKLSTIGISSSNISKSVILGFIVGGIFFLTAVIFAFVNNLHFVGYDYLAFGSIYYFFEIGFIEELIFRGYIQTRLVGFFKRSSIGIIITGLMFALMHIPFQMTASNMSLFAFIQADITHLSLTFFYHIIFSLLYYKYNNAAAPTIFHFFLNISYSLFR